MKKILHFTHIDSDALGCDVLLKYVYGELIKGYEITTHYISNHNVDIFISDTMRMLTLDIKNGSIDAYDKIYITDIGPNMDTIDTIIGYKKIVKEKLNIDVELYGFDHHVTNKLNIDYPWFIVADNLKSLFAYKELMLDPSGPFKTSYYPFRWMHDNTDKEYQDISEVENSSSMKISATMITLLHIITRVCPEIVYDTHIMKTLGDFAKDISCYDTWEWKTNKYVKFDGTEDRASKLVDMIGIQKATSAVLNEISFMMSCITITYGHYIPDKFSFIYNYQKYKSFEYVKRSYNNIVAIDGPNIKGFFKIIGLPTLYDETIEKIYLSISDDTVDLGEQSTFITNYLSGDEKCIFVHIFVSSKTISFRSKIGSVDVSKIAKCLGGGGHKTAAGTRVNAEIIGKLVVMYHINGKNILDMIDNVSVTKYITALSDYMNTLPKIGSDFIYDISDIMKG